MSRTGGILLEQLGDSVINYIKYEIDNHTHESEDISNVVTKDELKDSLAYKANVDHEHDNTYRRIEDSYSKEDIDSRIVEEITINNTIMMTSIKGILFNDSSTVKDMNNCIISESSNVEAVGNIIKTTGSSPYSMIFQINREMLFLGKNMYKVRLNTSTTSGKISLKINSVNSFELGAEDRVVGTIYTTTLDISKQNEFIDIYNVFDMKLLNASSVGIEILIEHQDKSEDYNLELDHIIITPAMPGMFI